MEAITLPIFNTEGKEVDSLKLDPGIFDGRINSAAIYQVVNSYRANQRKGLASTKDMGEVTGGGRKPWRQKGTGRARAGSIRSPLWRHGGVTFGPHPRDYSYQVPEKIRKLALKSSLNAKVKENNFFVIENLSLESPKTKNILKILSNLKIDIEKKTSKKVLVLLEKVDRNLKLAIRNIDFASFNLAKDTNTYEVLSSRRIVATKQAYNDLIKRLKK